MTRRNTAVSFTPMGLESKCRRRRDTDDLSV